MAIQDFVLGDKVEGFYILQAATSRTTQAGKPFLSMVLSDTSGTIEAMIWDYAGPVGPADAGNIVKVRGEVGEYRGSLQLNVKRLRLAEPDDSFCIEDLVPTAPIDVDKTWQEISDIIDGIEDADYRSIAQTLMERKGEQIRRIPAAKTVHHAFLNGLLMHTAYMLRLADYLSVLYSSVIDRSLLLTGTLLHDFAKCEEFEISKVGLVSDYSVKGSLLGHLVMGAEEVARTADELQIPEEKSVLLQHLILSHHGEPEYGAAVVPQCAEAELLSYIDKIDSRMEIYRENLADLEDGEFSRRIYALEHGIYRHG